MYVCFFCIQYPCVCVLPTLAHISSVLFSIKVNTILIERSAANDGRVDAGRRLEATNHFYDDSLNRPRAHPSHQSVNGFHSVVVYARTCAFV